MFSKYTNVLYDIKWKRNRKEKKTETLQKETISIPLTHIHDRSLSCLGTETSIKSDEVKLDLRLKSPLLQT